MNLIGFRNKDGVVNKIGLANKHTVLKVDRQN